VALDLALTAIREHGREHASILGRTGALFGEIPRSVRSLRRAPGFTAAAVLLLGLGIGVNAALFPAVRALLLADPPYPESDRLVLVRLSPRPPDGSWTDGFLWSYPALRLLTEMPDARIAPLAGFVSRTLTFQLGEQSFRASVEHASHSYLPLLGARPALGRLFIASEDDPASPTLVAVISHELWTAAFGADPDVVGTSVLARNQEVRIVGVLEPGLDGLTGDVDAWLPITAAKQLFSPGLIDSSSTSWFQVLGKLPTDVTIEEARTWADAAAHRVRQTYPAGGRGEIGATVQSLREGRSRADARAAVLSMAGAALGVLLIACANLGGLLIARGAARRQEIAIRFALGAGRARAGCARSAPARAGGAGCARWPARGGGGIGAGLALCLPDQRRSIQPRLRCGHQRRSHLPVCRGWLCVRCFARERGSRPPRGADGPGGSHARGVRLHFDHARRHTGLNRSALQTSSIAI
jgi:hypothetical protein